MKLNFRVYGEGQPFIILHGLFGMLDNWLNIAKELSRDYQVLIVDLRNHGLSEHSEEWDYTSMAADIASFIREQNMNNPIVLGHSMGGKVVMHLAIHQQYMLDRIIIVDIAPRYYPVHHQQILEALNSLELNIINTREEADKGLAAYITEWPIRQFLLKNLARGKDGFSWKMNLKTISENIENVGEAMPNGHMIDIPTLFIKGERSDYIQPADIQDIHNRFSDVEIKTVAGAGHWVHAEKPKELLKEVEAFISEQ